MSFHFSDMTPERSGTVGWGLRLLAPIAALTLLAACQSLPPQGGEPMAGFVADPFSTNSMYLREGDVIRIAFEGATNLNTTEKIQVDGLITLPQIGKVPAAGKSPAYLEALLEVMYESEIKTTDITVSLVASSAAVYVNGAVLKPGKLPLERPLTVLDAVMEAGGADPTRAKLSEVVVLRIENGRRVRYRVNLKRALQGNDPALLYLQPYDIIYVPEKTFNF